jgi:hypothetical protein
VPRRRRTPPRRPTFLPLPSPHRYDVSMPLPPCLTHPPPSAAARSYLKIRHHHPCCWWEPHHPHRPWHGDRVTGAHPRHQLAWADHAVFSSRPSQRCEAVDGFSPLTVQAFFPFLFSFSIINSRNFFKIPKFIENRKHVAKNAK